MFTTHITFKKCLAKLNKQMISAIQLNIFMGVCWGWGGVGEKCWGERDRKETLPQFISASMVHISGLRHFSKSMLKQ